MLQQTQRGAGISEISRPLGDKSAEPSWARGVAWVCPLGRQAAGVEGGHCVRTANLELEPSPLEPGPSPLEPARSRLKALAASAAKEVARPYMGGRMASKPHVRANKSEQMTQMMLAERGIA